MEICKICKRWVRASWPHECPPRWEIVRADSGEEQEEPDAVYAHDPDDAALTFVKDNHAAWDHPDEVEVWVRKGPDDAWQKFTITARMEPQFYVSAA
jgi:hypothetical protein